MHCSKWVQSLLSLVSNFCSFPGFSNVAFLGEKSQDGLEESISFYFPNRIFEFLQEVTEAYYSVNIFSKLSVQVDISWQFPSKSCLHGWSSPVCVYCKWPRACNRVCFSLQLSPLPFSSMTLAKFWQEFLFNGDKSRVRSDILFTSRPSSPQAPFTLPFIIDRCLRRLFKIRC